MTDVFALDRHATFLFVAAARSLTLGQLSASTPFEGRSVFELLAHVHYGHENFAARLLPAAWPPKDVRDGVAFSAQRWTEAVEWAGEYVPVDAGGRTAPTATVVGAHVVDMLVHRWDLAVALGRPHGVPDELTAAALPLAADHDSPVGRADRRAVPFAGDPTSLDALVARTGRRPS